MDKYLQEALFFATKLQNTRENIGFLKDKEALKELIKLCFYKEEKRANNKKIKELLLTYKNNNELKILEKAWFFYISKLFFLNKKSFLKLLRKKIQKDFKNKALSLKELINNIKKNKLKAHVFLLSPPALGEKAIEEKLSKLSKLLTLENIQGVSLNPRELYSQINLLNLDNSLKIASKRLLVLLKLAKKHKKSIHIDCRYEEDIFFSIELLKLSLKELDVKAGITLALAHKSSLANIKSLIKLSKIRVENALTPLKIRLVKGSFIDEERQAKPFLNNSFDKSLETSQAYIKALALIYEERLYRYAKISIATHNIFLLSYAYILAKKNDALACFEFEILGSSLKTPFKTEQILPVYEDFYEALPFLLNYLRAKNVKNDFSNLLVDSIEWDRMKADFIGSVKYYKELNIKAPFIKNMQEKMDFSEYEEKKAYLKESKIDFSLEANRNWALNIEKKCKNHKLVELYPFLNKQDDYEYLLIYSKKEKKEIARLHLSPASKILAAYKRAKISLDYNQIEKIFSKACFEIERKRADFISAIMLESGLSFKDALAELDKTLSYFKSYPKILSSFFKDHTKASFSSLGIGALKASNSFAKTSAAIAAALMSANALLLAPSKELALSLKLLCECLYEAKLSKNTLIYIPSHEDELLHILASKLSFYILFDEKAKDLLIKYPSLYFIAQKEAKSVYYIDKSYKDRIEPSSLQNFALLKGEKILILDEVIFENKLFKASLIDALSPTTTVKFLKENEAYSQAKSYESLILVKKVRDDKEALCFIKKLSKKDKNTINLSLYKEENYEAFLALKGKICLNKACLKTAYFNILSNTKLLNSRDYLLNFLSIKQDKFDTNMQVSPLSMGIREYAQKQSLAKLRSELDLAFNLSLNYNYFIEKYFKIDKNTQASTSYKPLKNTIYRVSKKDSFLEIMAVILACELLLIPLYLSFENNENMQNIQALIDFLKLRVRTHKENVNNFILQIPSCECLRYLKPASIKDPIYRNASLNAKQVISSKPLNNGRFELLLYLEESKLCINTSSF